MAVKSYLDKMNVINLGTRSQTEKIGLWSEFEAEIIMKRINLNAPQHQQVIYDEVVKSLKALPHS
ncbi:MAG: hypothetical protein FWB74_01925 [Defluviitaleaceae bacterium]|nr:hypothetical protein [Defluviitaleaceae bacterium]